MLLKQISLTKQYLTASDITIIQIFHRFWPNSVILTKESVKALMTIWLVSLLLEGSLVELLQTEAEK